MNEGEQFDMRLTVEEFKHSVNLYTLWKPGMEIYVSHVRRKNIPKFVFPGGVRPPRPSKMTWDSRRAVELKDASSSQVDKSSEGQGVPDEMEDGRKRKREEEVESNLKSAKVVATSASSAGEAQESALAYDATNGAADIGHDAVQNHITGGSGYGKPSGSVADESSSREAENLAIEKITSVSYVGRQDFSQELDELEDDVQQKDKDEDMAKGGTSPPIVSLTSNVSPTAAMASNGMSTSGSFCTSADLEELEVISANLSWLCSS